MSTSSPSRPSVRVLHVRSSHGRHGPERALLELLPSLAREGIAVHVLALHRPGRTTASVASAAGQAQGVGMGTGPGSTSGAQSTSKAHSTPDAQPSAGATSASGARSTSGAQLASGAPSTFNAQSTSDAPSTSDAQSTSAAQSTHSANRAFGSPAIGWLAEARQAGATTTAVVDAGPLSRAGVRAIGRAAQGADLVHTHDYRADLLAWAAGAGRSSRAAFPPWVATVHLHTNTTRRLRIYRHLDLRVLRKASVVLTVSPDQGEMLRAARAAGGDPDAVRVFPNVIDADVFASGAGGPEAVNALRARLLGPGEGPLLVFVGRLTRQKGVDVLLDALPAMRDRFPGLVVALAGVGPERAGLATQAVRMGLASAIRWLDEVDNVAALLSAGDVVMLPSRREGLPLVLLEAMAVGAPLIGTEIPGIAQAVVDGKTALLVPVDDATALAAATIRLLADPNLARALGSAAAVAVRSDYAPDAVAARLAALYRALVHPPRERT